MINQHDHTVRGGKDGNDASDFAAACFRANSEILGPSVQYDMENRIKLTQKTKSCDKSLSPYFGLTRLASNDDTFKAAQNRFRPFDVDETQAGFLSRKTSVQNPEVKRSMVNKIIQKGEDMKAVFAEVPWYTEQKNEGVVCAGGFVATSTGREKDKDMMIVADTAKRACELAEFTLRKIQRVFRYRAKAGKKAALFAKTHAPLVTTMYVFETHKKDGDHADADDEENDLMKEDEDIDDNGGCNDVISERVLVDVLQIVHTLYPSPAHVLFGFDIDACRVMVTGDGVFAHPSFERMLHTGFILFDWTTLSTSAAHRYAKYSLCRFHLPILFVGVPQKLLNDFRDVVQEASTISRIFEKNALDRQLHNMESMMATIWLVSAASNLSNIVELLNRTRRVDYAPNIENFINHRMYGVHNATLTPHHFLELRLTARDKMLTGGFNPLPFSGIEPVIERLYAEIETRQKGLERTRRIEEETSRNRYNKNKKVRV